jgi:hypothetical protein
MGGHSVFQLALELSNVFPMREVVVGVSQQLLNLARDFRKSGSDIVVELDLADVFGRGKISSELETKFKETTKISTIVPLTKDGEIILDSGPGPTLQHAFRDRRYLASVIQLSFLSYVHNREKLASMLSQSLGKRYDLNVPGASPDPGYEGIMKTLLACSSQTSSFSWSEYINAVQERLRAAIPTYAFSGDYLRLSPSLLLGAMDYLFLVQSLPEDRKVIVTNENGAITMIVWAHCILGLTVAIQFRGKVILFGTERAPHVTIEWTKESKEGANELFWPNETDDGDPTIRYLDGSMEIILESAPEKGQIPVEGAVADRHPVLNYGVAYLERLFNSAAITADNDPVYKESVNLITALAIHANNHLDRDYGRELRGNQSQQTVSIIPHGFYVEVWRILASARLLFAIIGVDAAAVDKYVEFYAKTRLDESTCPNSFEGFLRRVTLGQSSFSPAKRLLDQLKHLAKVVLIFAHVADVEKCAEMPIKLIDDHVVMAHTMSLIFKGPEERATLESSAIFHAVSTLLVDDFDHRGDDPRFTSQFLFLALSSDFGWSVFLDTVGDKDPASSRPDLVRVVKGTPTNSKTGERKFKIRDGGGFRAVEYPDSYPLTRGPEYTPSLAGRVINRKVFWSSRAQEFQATIYYSLEPSPEWRQHMAASIPTFDEIAKYRSMHDSLWETHLTTPCDHAQNKIVEKPIKLGPDALVLTGWNPAFEIMSPAPERILILRTRADPRIRWLAVDSNSRTLRSDPLYRAMMLRAPNCCEECALKHVAPLPGRWVLIL